MASYDIPWKIMMLGDKDAGKTSLLNRYTSKPFIEDQKLTTGVDFYTKRTNYKDWKIKLQIWDLASERCFRFYLHNYCRGANGALLLYNITNPRSFHNLPDWNHFIRDHAGDIPILLVGTEAHLEEKRAVTREEAIQIAQTHNFSGFIEVSSKTGQNIERLFETMTEILFRRYSP